MDIFWLLVSAGGIVIVALWASGRNTTPPKPSSLSDAALENRIRSETKWSERYHSLPFENQQGKLKSQNAEKEKYLHSLFLERKLRIEMAQAGLPLTETNRLQYQRYSSMAKEESEKVTEIANSLIKEGKSSEEAYRIALQESKIRVESKLEKNSSTF